MSLRTSTKPETLPAVFLCTITSLGVSMPSVPNARLRNTTSPSCERLWYSDLSSMIYPDVRSTCGILAMSNKSLMDTDQVLLGFMVRRWSRSTRRCGHGATWRARTSRDDFRSPFSTIHARQRKTRHSYMKQLQMIFWKEKTSHLDLKIARQSCPVPTGETSLRGWQMLSGGWQMLLGGVQFLTRELPSNTDFVAAFLRRGKPLGDSALPV